jgi:single-stranded-DNA-specific exonuclease
VALKLAWQVAREVCGTHRVDEKMRKFLLDATTLAALGTVADVVPLLGENRSLVTFGLQGLAATDHSGIAALRDAAGLDGGKLDSFDVGFKLAPRLNACGRMGHARLAVELLTGPEPTKARKIADYLTQQNTQRQKVEKDVLAQAVEMVQARGLDSQDAASIVLAGQDWHGGVVGIVASRLVERYAKPTILISRNGQSIARGSGRSIPGLHMRDALAACADLLVRFGGHAMAGGLAIETSQLDAFAERFGQVAAEQLQAADLTTGLEIDAEAGLEDLAYPAVERIDRMGPFGSGNPRPVVALRNCKVVNPPRRMGKTGRTVGMVLGQGPVTLRAVGFGMGDLTDLLSGVNEIDVAAEPVLNHFRGRTSVELQLRDVCWQGMD